MRHVLELLSKSWIGSCHHSWITRPDVLEIECDQSPVQNAAYCKHGISGSHHLLWTVTCNSPTDLVE